MTPSAVSQQIARLEAETKVTVLDRHTSGVTLTPAGRVLAEAAEQIELELNRAERELLSMSGEVTGTVRVGSFPSVIRTILLPLLTNLEELLPGVDLVVKEVETEEGLPALRSGDLDVLILERDATVRSTTPRGLRDVVLLDEPWLLITPSTLPTLRSLSDAAHRPWLDTDPTSAGGLAVRRVTARLGVPASPHRAIDHSTTLRMVGAGLGTTVLPALSLRAHQVEGVAANSFPGLGARRIIARHRATRDEPTSATTAAIDAMLGICSEITGDIEKILDA